MFNELYSKSYSKKFEEGFNTLLNQRYSFMKRYYSSPRNGEELRRNHNSLLGRVLYSAQHLSKREMEEIITKVINEKGKEYSDLYLYFKDINVFEPIKQTL